MERVSPGVWTAVAVELPSSASYSGRDVLATLPFLQAAAETPEKPVPHITESTPGQPSGDQTVKPFASESPAERKNYYAARAVEARNLANAAADRSIALIHLEMALRYDILAHHEVEEDRPLRIVR